MFYNDGNANDSDYGTDILLIIMIIVNTIMWWWRWRQWRWWWRQSYNIGLMEKEDFGHGGCYAAAAADKKDYADEGY